jgi:hypothetical protein
MQLMEQMDIFSLLSRNNKIVDGILTVDYDVKIIKICFNPEIYSEILFFEKP